MELNKIRADFNADSIVLYQAYSPAIALPTIQAKRFVAPFSFGRMTWIKPSFLWLMERSNWAQKAGQQHILAVRLTRAGWEEALSQGVLTAYVPKIHRSQPEWQQAFDQAPVHVQWDPERTLRGADAGCNSIQVGISRHLIHQFVEEWITDITDYTPLVRKIHALLKAGQADKAKQLLPPEKLYPVGPELARRLGMG